MPREPHICGSKGGRSTTDEKRKRDISIQQIFILSAVDRVGTILAELICKCRIMMQL